MLSVLRARLVDEPLWPFALALYAQEGVEAACLQLQDDAGADVCELLWRCWLLQHGAVPQPDCESALVEVRRWQRDVTLPLRRLRRELKAAAGSLEGVARLRDTLKQAELQAERETLTRLEALAMTRPLRMLSPADQPAEKILLDALQLQKKPYLSTLNRLVTRLDPPRSPR
ncbi:TIGR02444 family protein [Halomonas marinisediminis]|uniref:TIGR02444 family protein n=3 Tax=Halomonadaceae TaxID=28256 RepID=A0A7X4W020_9GAMM|nr:TIGR02444 family protein [Halomonas icarae]TDB03312.1 TIGR02444 family protein [Halomonas marinisediminis]